QVSTIERQVFDFLGYMWAPILANFFNIIFVIFGFYGAFQFRPKYIITINNDDERMDDMQNDSDVLNLGTGSVSWWEVNGAGCRPIYPTNLTVDDPYPFRPLRPDKVMDCVLDYKYVETFHAALQCLLAVLGGVGGVLASQTSLGRDRNFNFLDDFESNRPEHLALHPMSVPSTECSVMMDGWMGGEIDRQANTSQRVVGCMWTITKNEVVSKEAKMAVYKSLSTPTLFYGCEAWVCREKHKSKTNKYGYKRNGSLNQTSLYSIEFSQPNVEDAIEFEEENNQFPDRPLSPRPMTPRRVKRRSVISRGSTSRTSQHDKRGSGTYNNTMRHSHRSSYRRSNLQHQNPVTRLIEQQQNLDSSTTSNESANRLHYPGSSQADLITPTQQWKKSTGHTNPVYEQNSTQSLNDDDIYNNRPSSARSSYSNYHGTRPISGYRGPGNAYFMTSQATPQVPVSNAHKHNSHRNHAAFLCSGPPPYHVDGAVNSETVI
ncbi:unnamed protein product, partial [Timema podura]|nr:unnamed protein product [Timema podura]